MCGVRTCTGMKVCVFMHLCVCGMGGKCAHVSVVSVIVCGMCTCVRGWVYGCLHLRVLVCTYVCICVCMDVWCGCTCVVCVLVHVCGSSFC